MTSVGTGRKKSVVLVGVRVNLSAFCTVRNYESHKKRAPLQVNTPKQQLDEQFPHPSSVKALSIHYHDHGGANTNCS